MFSKRFSYSVNDFYMFNKWFSLSANDFYMFNKRFLYSANGFYIQQEIYIFSNMKFVFSNMRFIFNNLRFAFNEMKFMKLKPFTFSKPNLDVTKYTIRSIRQNKDLVCKLYIQSVSIFSHFSNILCTLQRWCLRAKFSVSFYCLIGQWTYARNWDGVGAWSNACGGPQVFCMIITMTCAYSFSWGLQQNVVLA